MNDNYNDNSFNVVTQVDILKPSYLFRSNQLTN